MKCLILLNKVVLEILSCEPSFPFNQSVQQNNMTRYQGALYETTDQQLLVITENITYKSQDHFTAI